MKSVLQSERGRIGAVIGGLLVVATGCWFLLVAPQRSKVAQLDTEISATRVDLSQRRLALARPSASVKIRPSDLYRLTKALPNSTDMAGILLDVNRLAGRNSLDFSAITPGTEQLGTGFVEQPLSVVVVGRFGDVSHFLGDIRTLVRVRKGRLDARGRLYSVSQVDIAEPDQGKKFPVVKATVTLNAFAFSAPTAPSTTPSTTTDAPVNGTVAAGVTP